MIYYVIPLCNYRVGDLAITMSSYIEFWCNGENGISLYHHSTSKYRAEISSDLISSFLSALQLIIKENTNEKIEKINFKNSHLFILHSHGLFFFLRTQRNIMEKRENNFLITLRNEFVKQFKPILSNWRGRVDEFAQFDKTMNRILKKKKKSDFIFYPFGSILHPSVV